MSYNPLFLDCFLNTAHAGHLVGSDVITFSHSSAQLFSSFSLDMICKKGVIKQAHFQASTTPALIAVGEYVCRFIEGMSIADCVFNTQKCLADLELSATWRHVVALVDLVLQSTLAIAINLQ